MFLLHILTLYGVQAYFEYNSFLVAKVVWRKQEFETFLLKKLKNILQLFINVIPTEFVITKNITIKNQWTLNNSLR